MITFLSCAAAGTAASAAAPVNAVRRLIMKAMAKSPLFPWTLFPEASVCEHLAGAGAPADMSRLPDLGHESAGAVGDLHHQPVGRRQAHMDIDLRAEIGDEFHRAGQVVVESRERPRADFQPLGPQRQGGAAGGAAG